MPGSPWTEQVPRKAGNILAKTLRLTLTLSRDVDLSGDAGEDRFRWVVRIPEDALDDPDLLVLPTVDPVVFTSERELARGGMGRITRARDRRLGRDVAIKEVLAPELRARFEREVAITARLQHPAIRCWRRAAEGRYGSWRASSAIAALMPSFWGTLAISRLSASPIPGRWPPASSLGGAYSS